MSSKLTTSIIDDMLENKSLNEPIESNYKGIDTLIRDYYFLKPVYSWLELENFHDLNRVDLKGYLEQLNLPTRTIDDSKADVESNNFTLRNKVWELVYFKKTKQRKDIYIELNISSNVVTKLLKSLGKLSVTETKVPKEVIKTVLDLRDSVSEKVFRKYKEEITGLSTKTINLILEASALNQVKGLQKDLEDLHITEELNEETEDFDTLLENEGYEDPKVFKEDSVESYLEDAEETESLLKGLLPSEEELDNLKPLSELEQRRRIKEQGLMSEEDLELEEELGTKLKLLENADKGQEEWHTEEGVEPNMDFITEEEHDEIHKSSFTNLKEEVEEQLTTTEKISNGLDKLDSLEELSRGTQTERSLEYHKNTVEMLKGSISSALDNMGDSNEEDLNYTKYIEVLNNALRGVLEC